MPIFALNKRTQPRGAAGLRFFRFSSVVLFLGLSIPGYGQGSLNQSVEEEVHPAEVRLAPEFPHFASLSFLQGRSIDKNEPSTTAISTAHFNTNRATPDELVPEVHENTAAVFFEPSPCEPDSGAAVRRAHWQQGRCCPEQSCPGPAACGCFRSLAWQKGLWQITPYGFLTGEFVASDASITPRPFVLYVNEDVGVSEQQFTVHGQTTALGFDITGPYVGTLQAGGNILFNFLGDRPVLNQSTPFLLRAFGLLENEDWRFGFGVAPDIFGPVTPKTVNFGGHLQAGNIAAFRGQIRVERFIQVNDEVLWTTMAAISQQVVSDFVANPTAIGTDNGWPNVEGRLLLGLGRAESGEAPVQIGLSGVVGETRAIGIAGGNVSNTWGVSADGQIDCGRFGARCEIFTGEAIGTYNAAIGQSLNPEDGEAIATVGGFGELWCKPADCLTWHVGYGIDNPKDSDLGRIVDPMLGAIAGQRSRNAVYWTNLMWNVTDFFELGFEVSQRETDYIAPSVSNEAMVYHFRSRLTF